MPQRNKSRRQPREVIDPKGSNVAGGKMFSPNIRSSRFAGAGAAMAAKGAQQASMALGTYVKERQIEDTQSGAAMAFKGAELPEGASVEMAESWYSTQGVNDGNRMRTVLTDYLVENPDTTYDEYSTYAKEQFNASIQDKPDAYSINYGSKAIPVMEESLRGFKVQEETKT